MADREDNVYMAKLAEQAERYDGKYLYFLSFHHQIILHSSRLLLFLEMLDSMKSVAAMDIELTVEERNLLSVAYKNVIGTRRAAWRIVSSIEQKEESKSGEDKIGLVRTYRQQVKKKIDFIFYMKSTC